MEAVIVAETQQPGLCDAQGERQAVAIGLTGDPTEDVATYLNSAGLPVRQLVVLGPEGPVGQQSVPSDSWAMGWTRAARAIVRAEVRASGAKRVHLFFNCPAGIALMLGHQWNNVPDTVVYEFIGNTYEPTLTVPGL